MRSAEPSPQRGRGRRRLPAVDQAILAATVELLAEGGLDAATTQQIASRCRVAKTTIYRRWPSRDALLLDAFRQVLFDSVSEIAGEPAGADHRALIDQLARHARAVVGTPLFAAILPVIGRHALTDTELGAQLRESVFEMLRAAARERLEHGKRRQSIRANADLDAIVDLTYGGVLFRALSVGRLDAAGVAAITDVVIAGTAPGSTAS